MGATILRRPVRLVHYGLLKEVLPITVRQSARSYLHKPEGERILWTSPEGARYGWEWWAGQEMPEYLNHPRQRLMLAVGAKVWRIDGMRDLERLPRLHHLEGFDWVEVARRFDAVWLSAKGHWETRLTHPLSTYSWDCETIVIFNEKVVSRVGVSA